MAASSRKVTNKFCSSRPAIKPETVKTLTNLRVVSRFYRNTRVQHGNQRTTAWNYFGFLFQEPESSVWTQLNSCCLN